LRRILGGVTHAVVLIRAEREALSTLGGQLAELDGVSEAFSVTGEWDFVALVRVGDPERLAKVVTEGLAQLPGIARTYTMTAFRTYSEHDLEAMFSIGG
jgi:DNA-binding Lrp family transcriptional regulator